MRKELVVAGTVSLLLGVTLAAFEEPPEPKESIWEEARIEEIYTNIQEEGAAEDIPEHETDSSVKEGASDSGSDSTSKCDGDEEEPYEAAGQVTDLTYEEAQLLMRIAQAEAGNQGEEGMWLVMSVVLNRVNNSDFPNSIRDVIYQPHHFSSVSDGSFDKVEVFCPEVHEALARIEEGDLAPEIVGFEVVGSDELDKYFARAFEYRGHRFYTQKGD